MTRNEYQRRRNAADLDGKDGLACSWIGRADQDAKPSGYAYLSRQA
jgi:hypothetical protein